MSRNWHVSSQVLHPVQKWAGPTFKKKKPLGKDRFFRKQDRGPGLRFFLSEFQPVHDKLGEQ